MDQAMQLSGSEADRLQRFISSVTDYAIFMLTPTGDVASWNAGAQRFKGYTADEIIGQHFSRFYTDEDRARRLPWHALQVAQQQGKFETEGWRVRKDATRFWANVVIDPVHDPAGNLLGFAKITRDITERRRAQKELELAREALLQSQKLEAIGKLTGGIAHDFNNLLNVLGNGLELLQRRVHDPEELRLIDTMIHATSRGAALTQQLSGFAGEQSLKPEPSDLSEVIRSFEAVLRRASRSAIRLEFDLAERLPAARIDLTHFELALLNLVANARDATMDGGRITISTCVRTLRDGELPPVRAGCFIEVAVEDSGAGMSPDVRARALEPFFTTGRGRGLGLSQAQEMVQECGGDMHIRSAPHEGTTVRLLFPTADAEEVIAGGAFKAEKVLVVDDQPEVLDMTCELFRTLGMNAIPALSAREALETLGRTPDIELMLSDVMLPGMDGPELARRARELRPNLNIMLASGYTAPARSAAGGQLEGFAFLCKPYRLGDIVRSLREFAFAPRRSRPSAA